MLLRHEMTNWHCQLGPPETILVNNLQIGSNQGSAWKGKLSVISERFDSSASWSLFVGVGRLAVVLHPVVGVVIVAFAIRWAHGVICERVHPGLWAAAKQHFFWCGEMIGAVTNSWQLCSPIPSWVSRTFCSYGFAPVWLQLYFCWESIAPPSNVYFFSSDFCGKSWMHAPLICVQFE